MDELITNSGDHNETPRPAASDLGLHCLPVTRLGVFSLKWVYQHRIYPKHSDRLALTKKCSCRKGHLIMVFSVCHPSISF